MLIWQSYFFFSKVLVHFSIGLLCFLIFELYNINFLYILDHIRVLQRHRTNKMCVYMSYSFYMKVKSESEVAQSCPTPSDLMGCSLPDSYIHGIFQARVLEWGAIAFSVNFA